MVLFQIQCTLSLPTTIHFVPWAEIRCTNTLSLWFPHARARTHARPPARCPPCKDVALVLLCSALSYSTLELYIHNPFFLPLSFASPRLSSYIPIIPYLYIHTFSARCRQQQQQQKRGALVNRPGWCGSCRCTMISPRSTTPLPAYVGPLAAAIILRLRHHAGGQAIRANAQSVAVH